MLCIKINFMKTEINTLIISDIHLGSEVARPKAVKDLLMSYDFKRLILLGDIFDSLNFSRLKKEHWNLLSYIRKLSNPGNNIKVIWVEGNHDEGLSEIMSHLIGIKVFKEYYWISNGRKYLAIHGHQFDRFLNENIIISSISSYLYYKIQKYDRANQNISRFIKKRSKGWLRLSNKVADGALYYDFWGIAPDDNSKANWQGFTRFKKGFSGKSVSSAKAQVFVYQAGFYKAYNFAKKLRKFFK